VGSAKLFCSGKDWQLFWWEGQGWQSKTVWQVFAKSKEKIGDCSGRRVKGGRARQFGKSLASQRRRLAIVLAGEPRVAEQDGSASLWQVKGEDWQLFWREGQGWQSKTVWVCPGLRLRGFKL
jgi:hypothetical protein